jgi:hypothetical protein
MFVAYSTTLVSHFGYTASNERVMVNDALERILDEAVVA